MGAWGVGAFENDAALDWVVDLRRGVDLALVESAFSLAVGDSENLDADIGCCVLAAAEVVARLRGRAGKPNKDVDAFVAAHPQQPSAELIDLALRAIDRVTGDDSELAELWEDDPEWRADVAALRKRVA